MRIAFQQLPQQRAHIARRRSPRPALLHGFRKASGFRLGHAALQIALHVGKGVGVAGRRGRAAQAFHQAGEVTPSGRREVAPQVAEKPAAQPILGWAVGHQQILVAGVELKQALLGQADFQQPPPMGEGDHLGKESVAPVGVPQPSVLLHRQLRPGLDNPMRKQPAPIQP